MRIVVEAMQLALKSDREKVKKEMDEMRTEYQIKINTLLVLEGQITILEGVKNACEEEKDGG